MMKIVYFGSAEFAIPTLELLAGQRDLQICKVVTKPDQPAGRGLKLTPNPLKRKALELNLPIADKLPTKTELQEWGVDKIVVVAYGKFIPEEIFKNWPCINLHPSLLPKYRGPSPLQSALLNGDTLTGITTMLIGAGMDDGDILLQQEIPLDINTDFAELQVICASEGAKLILESLKLDINKSRKPQDNSKSIICKKIQNNDGLILPGDEPLKIHNIVRAIGGYVELGNKRIKILKTKYENNKLEIITVQPEGKLKMSYTDYLKGNAGLKL